MLKTNSWPEWSAESAVASRWCWLTPVQRLVLLERRWRRREQRWVQSPLSSSSWRRHQLHHHLHRRQVSPTPPPRRFQRSLCSRHIVVRFLVRRIALATASDSAHTFLRSVVCLSVCRLSHSCTLLKPFDGCRWHFDRYACKVRRHIVRWGSLTLRGRGDLGSKPRPKHAIANWGQTVSPMLPPGE